MSKTTSGIILVVGPIVSFIGAAMSATANTALSTPDTDWMYSIANGLGVVLILAGLAMFFFGAKRFSRPEM